VRVRGRACSGDRARRCSLARLVRACLGPTTGVRLAEASGVGDYHRGAGPTEKTWAWSERERNMGQPPRRQSREPAARGCLRCKPKLVRFRTEACASCRSGHVFSNRRRAPPRCTTGVQALIQTRHRPGAGWATMRTSPEKMAVWRFSVCTHFRRQRGGHGLVSPEAARDWPSAAPCATAPHWPAYNSGQSSRAPC